MAFASGVSIFQSNQSMREEEIICSHRSVTVNYYYCYYCFWWWWWCWCSGGMDNYCYCSVLRRSSSAVSRTRTSVSASGRRSCPNHRRLRRSTSTGRGRPLNSRCCCSRCHSTCYYSHAPKTRRGQETQSGRNVRIRPLCCAFSSVASQRRRDNN